MKCEQRSLKCMSDVERQKTAFYERKASSAKTFYWFQIKAIKPVTQISPRQTNRWIIEKEWKCFSIMFQIAYESQKEVSSPLISLEIHNLSLMFTWVGMEKNCFITLNSKIVSIQMTKIQISERTFWCFTLKTPTSMKEKQSKLLKSLRWTIYARMNEFPFRKKTQIHSTCIITRDGIFSSRFT